jgi:hypothetical protein
MFSTISDADKATLNSDKSKTRWGPVAGAAASASKANGNGPQTQSNQSELQEQYSGSE